MKIVIDRDETIRARKTSKNSIVAYIDERMALYRIIDGEELTRIVKKGRVEGGMYSVKAERSFGASWAEDKDEVIEWGLGQRKWRLGKDLFLLEMPRAGGNMFFHLDMTAPFDPLGPPQQPATTTTKCDTGLGCSMRDVGRHQIKVYAVSDDGTLTNLSSADVDAYAKKSPLREVDMKAVNPNLYYTGTIHDFDVAIVKNQESVKLEVRGHVDRIPSKHYHTWGVEDRHGNAFVVGASSYDKALAEAVKFLKKQKPTADDFEDPVDLLPVKRQREFDKMVRDRMR